MAEEESIATDLFLHHQPVPVFSSHIGSRSASGSESDTDNEPPNPDLALSLGLGFEDDDFFIGRRSTSGSGSESYTDDEFSSRSRQDGLRILSFESDSDSDGQIVAIGDNSNDQVDGHEETIRNPNLLPLCWDCLQIDEDRRESNEEFEWEEIDGGLDEREVISINVNQDQEELEEDDEEMSRNVEWEFLLAMNNLRSPDEDEGFVYTTSENDEILLGQFQEQHDRSLKGGPPASKSVVESLPSIVLRKDNGSNDSNLSCAVCKDEIGVEEKAKRLPCSHCYHEECILPWLAVRNTCPLCRYELPTDDAEYESWKARREESRVRYDFEMLPEA